MNLLVQLPKHRPHADHHVGLLSYMEERYRIWLRRHAGQPAPWTKDEILQKYKFTNVYRHLDRTTQELMPMFRRHKDSPLSVQFVNGTIARYFGYADTVNEIGWQETVKKDGRIEPSVDVDHIFKVIADRKKYGEQIFTGAYMIAQGGRTDPKEEVVVDNVLAILSKSKELEEVAKKTDSWEHVVSAMQFINGFGGSGFMAKEVCQDVMMYAWSPADKMTWTPVGPGGRRGLNRIHLQPLKAKADAKTCQDQIKALRKNIMKVWNPEWPELSAHDIQFSLCEYDKYCRVALGEGRPRSLFKPCKEGMLYDHELDSK